jgi:hypothetical protein
MKDLPKGRNEVRQQIFSVIWRADPDQSRLSAEARRRILQSFQGREDGRELADGLIEMVDYYTLVGYWRGYRDAKRHYDTTLKRQKTPADRRYAERFVASMIRRNPDAATKDICKALDEVGISAGFGRHDYFGPRIGTRKADVASRWIDGHAEPAVRQWIHRIRKRVRTEMHATKWLKRSSEVWPK